MILLLNVYFSDSKVIRKFLVLDNSSCFQTLCVLYNSVCIEKSFIRVLLGDRSSCVLPVFGAISLIRVFLRDKYFHVCRVRLISSVWHVATRQ